VDVTADLGDNVRGYLCNTPAISPGTLNGIFDDTATVGIHAVMGTPASRTLMTAIGMQAEPAEGDPVFVGQYHQLAMKVSDDNDAVVATIPFAGWDAAALTNYSKAWGVLLHENSAETAVNDQPGVDDYGAATAGGGYMMYQIFTSNAAGTVTIRVQDAAVNNDGGFADLAGATTTAIGHAAIPTAGIVALANNAAVRRYLRWQITLAGGMATVTFALAFVRG